LIEEDVKERERRQGEPWISSVELIIIGVNRVDGRRCEGERERRE